MSSYNWGIIFEHRWEFFIGFLHTIGLFLIPALLAFLLGCAVAAAMRTDRVLVRSALRLYIDGIRVLPFLIFIYLLYYALPIIGITLNAFTIGLLGMSVYHAAYVAEILRGSWDRLDPGQTEAARMLGYHGFKLFRRIILPQLLLNATPLIGNQLVYMLKDTSFLLIITITELTFVASSIQGLYYIVYEPFIVAIALYWLLCLLIERLVAVVERYATEKGFGHE